MRPWSDGFYGWIVTNNCPDVTNGPPDWPKQLACPLIPVTLIMEKKWEDISAWVQTSELGWHTLRTSGIHTVRTCCKQRRTWDQCSETQGNHVDLFPVVSWCSGRFWCQFQLWSRSKWFFVCITLIIQKTSLLVILIQNLLKGKEFRSGPAESSYKHSIKQSEMGMWHGHKKLTNGSWPENTHTD